MNCNVIADLLPLYCDNCCSEESRRLVEEHLAHCEQCRRLEEEFQCDLIGERDTAPNWVRAENRVDRWRASVLQTVLFFALFGLLVVGVFLEDRATGFDNGKIALYFVSPVTAQLLSLANWFFIRFYPNRKKFMLSCAVCTAITVSAAMLFCAGYYHSALFFAGAGASPLSRFAICTAVAAISCALLPVLACVYAKYLGKE